MSVDTRALWWGVFVVDLFSGESKGEWCREGKRYVAAHSIGI